MNKKKKPRIRFKGFTDDWEQRKVLDLLDLLTDFDANGSFADMAKNVNTFDGNGFAWYVRMTDLDNPKPLDELKYVDKPSYDFLRKTHLHGGELLMAKRGNIGEIYIFEPRTEYATVAPNMYLLKLNTKVIPIFLYNFFLSDEGKRQLFRLNASTTMGALYKDDVKNIDVIIPPIEEQKKIAEYFAYLDNLITLHQRKCEKLKIIKKSMLENCFPKNGQKVPKIRFSGFTGDWEQRKLKDIAPLQRGFDLPTTEMCPGNYPVVMSNGIGGYHSTYKVNGPGVVTGRSGTIGKLQYIEDNYWPHNTTLWVTNFYGNNPKYIYYLYQNLDFSRFTSGSGVPTLNRNDVHDFWGNLPSIGEQLKIEKFMTNLDEFITLHQSKLEKLKKIKKSMLERMFV